MKYLFLDTNIYLHYQDFQQIPWNKVLEIDDEFTIVVAPKVHAELDEKKDSAKGKIQRRAKKISSRLYEILMKQETTKIPVVRCKAPNPTEEDKRMLDLSRSDNVIILTAIRSGWNNDDIVIISADKNIQFTAEDFGLGHYLMSDDYLLPPEQDEKDIEIQKLRYELEQLKSRHSSPYLSFEGNTDKITFTRPLQRNLDDELKCVMAEAVVKYPEATRDNYPKVIDDPTYLFTRQVDDSKIKVFNDERIEYLKEEYEYQQLKLAKEISDESYKKISFIVVNDGTAPTGDMMVFIRVPDSIKLYSYQESRDSKSYLTPLAPVSGMIPLPRKTRRAMLNMPTTPFVGSQNTLWIWNEDKPVKNNTFKEEVRELLHGLLVPLDTVVYVNVSKTDSFPIAWSIIDASLPEKVTGILEVVIE